MHEHLKKLGIPVLDPDSEDYVPAVAILRSDSVTVTESEAMQLRSYVEYVCEGPAWCSTADEMMISTPDGGYVGGYMANTATFLKKDEGEWYYTLVTWANPLKYYPPVQQPARLSLSELLDKLGDDSSWAEWKSLHPEIFVD